MGIKTLMDILFNGPELHSSQEDYPYLKFVHKDPVPMNTNIVGDILKNGGYYSGYSNIWNALGSHGYNVKSLKRERKQRRLSMRQYLGMFPRPVLESVLKIINSSK